MNKKRDLVRNSIAGAAGAAVIGSFFGVIGSISAAVIGAIVGLAISPNKKSNDHFENKNTHYNKGTTTSYKSAKVA